MTKLVDSDRNWYKRLKDRVSAFAARYPTTTFVSKHMVFVAVIFLLNPFGLKDYTDQYTEDLLSRFMAPFYQDKGQSEIVVVQINDAVLKELNLSWPISYQQHAKILRRILSYQPRAVFVDFIYSQNRDQKGLASLKRILQKHNNPYGRSPVYIADIIDTQGSILLPELQQDVLRTRVNWSYFSEQYPLKLQENEGLWETPATALYKIFCQKEDCGNLKWLANPEPLTVAWGTRVDPIMNYVTSESQGCLTYDPGLSGGLEEGYRLLKNHAFLGLHDEHDFDQRVRQQCPYSRYLFANQLAYRNDTTEALLNDKIVLLGGIFHGIPDYVNSPVHGKVPGVFLHAMALDNLITQGEHYMRAPNPIFSFASFDWADLIELLLMVVILTIIARHNHKVRPLWQLCIVFIIVVALNLLTAVTMSLYLHYPPVNALAILLLSSLAMALLESPDAKPSNINNHGEQDDVA